LLIIFDILQLKIIKIDPKNLVC